MTHCKLGFLLEIFEVYWYFSETKFDFVYSVFKFVKWDE